MGYKITISENNKYIVVTYEGTFTLDLAKRSTKEFVEVLESTGIQRVLCDVRNTSNVMSVLEGFNYLNKYAGDIGFSKNVRLAGLASEHDKSYEFNETLAINAGYNLKLFYSFQKANDWLTQY
ncbi:MAG: hypothetical protein MI867_23705 [Pseudomonadales bacterium]|nr:hypothetical protein [Pseudomonadales bacterium]